MAPVISCIQSWKYDQIGDIASAYIDRSMYLKKKIGLYLALDVRDGEVASLYKWH